MNEKFTSTTTVTVPHVQALKETHGTPSPLGAPPGSDYQMSSDFFERPLSAEEWLSPKLDLAEEDFIYIVGVFAELLECRHVAFV